MQSVVSAEELLAVKAAGEHRRHIGETNMNLKSSRSHTIFTIKIEMRDTRALEQQDETASGKPSVGANDDVCFGVLVSRKFSKVISP